MKINKKNEKWEKEENADIVIKVHEAQIGHLHEQTWIALTGVIVVTFSVCFALWGIIPRWKLLSWGGVLIFIYIARAYFTKIFQKRSIAGPQIYEWAKLHVSGVMASGFMWALPPLFLWPTDSPVHQLIWPICIVSLTAAAISTYCTWMPSYISFLLLSMLPLSLRLLWEGGMVHTVLGLLGLFFTVFLVKTGRMMHSASVVSLVMGIRNESLNGFLSEEKAKQEELTRKLQIAHDQLRKLSMTDELTGLWNRRFLNATISEDVAQVMRNYHNIGPMLEKPLIKDIDIIFAIVDLDHFKAVNDTYGHIAGDQVLTQMRQILIESSREMDTVIRWGGEEFMVVARNVCRDNYVFLVERIRRAVETHRFDIGERKALRLTCSVGAAAFPFLQKFPDGLSWDRVVEVADASLYAAKHSGRNAWVGIIPTAKATMEDLTSDFVKNIPELIDCGKLEMKTNLPDNVIVSWSESRMDLSVSGKTDRVVAYFG